MKDDFLILITQLCWRSDRPYDARWYVVSIPPPLHTARDSPSKLTLLEIKIDGEEGCRRERGLRLQKHELLFESEAYLREIK